jgi:integrase
MASVRVRSRKDGTTYHQCMWRDPDTGKQTSVSFDTRGEAELLRRALDANGNSYVIAEAVFMSAESNLTVSDVVLEHIDLLTKPTSQTIHNYRAMLENHIGPTIGGIAVTALDYRHISHWIKGMHTKGLSPKTIRNVHGLLAAAMNTGIRLKYRADNPCAGVDLPTTERAHDKEMFLTLEEWNLIYSHLNPRYQPLALFLVITGARFGEATAVQVGDYAPSRVVNGVVRPATVRISKAWKRDGSTGFYIGAPKTASSKRTVSISPMLVEALLPLMDGAPGAALLFRSDTSGTRIPQSKMWKEWMAAVAAATADDPAFTKMPRLHDLRHTSASWALQGGMTLYEVARRLGHSSTQTTEKVYAHLMESSMTKGADVFTRMLES